MTSRASATTAPRTTTTAATPGTRATVRAPRARGRTGRRRWTSRLGRPGRRSTGGVSGRRVCCTLPLLLHFSLPSFVVECCAEKTGLCRCKSTLETDNLELLRHGDVPGDALQRAQARRRRPGGLDAGRHGHPRAMRRRPPLSVSGTVAPACPAAELCRASYPPRAADTCVPGHPLVPPRQRRGRAVGERAPVPGRLPGAARGGCNFLEPRRAVFFTTRRAGGSLLLKPQLRRRTAWGASARATSTSACETRRANSPPRVGCPPSERRAGPDSPARSVRLRCSPCSRSTSASSR